MAREKTGSDDPQPADLRSRPASQPASQQATPADDAQAYPPDDAQAQAAASRGAQVILDPDSAAAIGARGAADNTVEGNTAVRDQHLVSHGLDPVAPSGENLPRNTVPAGGETDPAKAVQSGQS